MDGPLIRRVESTFTGASGHGLFRRAWIAEAPRRAFVLTHGYAEHSGRYEHVGSWLAARGSAVHAFDHQGHGQSDGKRGHAASLDALVDDLDLAVEHARAEHPELPLYVLGHSMGGLVALAHAALRRPRLDGVVSSAAALVIDPPPNALERLGLRLLRPLLPKLSLPREIDDAALSRDPEVGRAYRADPLVFQTMTLGLAGAIYYGGQQTLAAASQTQVPALLLHGADDPIASPTGSSRFAAALSSPDSELRVIPGLRHEILNEPEWETVLGDILDWIERRERAAGGEG